MSNYEAAILGALLGVLVAMGFVMGPPSVETDGAADLSEPAALEHWGFEHLELPSGCNMSWGIQGDQRAPISIAWARYVDARCNG